MAILQNPYTGDDPDDDDLEAVACSACGKGNYGDCASCEYCGGPSCSCNPNNHPVELDR